MGWGLGCCLWAWGPWALERVARVAHCGGWGWWCWRQRPEGCSSRAQVHFYSCSGRPGWKVSAEWRAGQGSGTLLTLCTCHSPGQGQPAQCALACLEPL